jgi:hypothetical protein
MRWARYVAYVEEMRNLYNILIEKSEGRRLCDRSKLTWEGNIKLDLEN